MGPWVSIVDMVFGLLVTNYRRISIICTTVEMFYSTYVLRVVVVVIILTYQYHMTHYHHSFSLINVHLLK